MHLQSIDYPTLGVKPRIIPVVSTKGGEGKSTQSANLAGFLADAGIKTLLIDGDHAQPTASSIFPLEYEAPGGLYELLMQTVDLSNPDNLISRTSINNLDIIVSNDPRNFLPTAMLNAPDGRVRLRNALSHPLFNSYGVIIVDSQGSRSVMSELRGMPAKRRLAERQQKAKPRLKSLESWLREKVKTLSRHSELAKAFTYVLNQWPALAYYTDDGWAEADNNIAENALRMVSLGRKNYLFFGSDHGGERGALLYSLIGTCKLNGVEPESYLRHVLNVIADWPINRVSELLPWRVALPTE